MRTAAETYTPEDLLEMPDGDRYELIDGELVEKPMSALSSYVAGELLNRMCNHVKPKKLGWIFPEGVTYQCFPHDPNMVRKADVSFIRLNRFSKEQLNEEGHVTVVPDIAAEVVSPNDGSYDLSRKIQDYLDAGVRLIWVIDPPTRTAHVYRSNGKVARLEEKDELSGERILAGFRCRIGELFKTPVD
jgi:Uma2 family endonuclease